MNKFQRVACQMVKDDFKKRSNPYSFNIKRNVYLSIFRTGNYPIKKALGFKNYNKTLNY